MKTTDIIKDQVNDFLERSGQNVDELQAEMHLFLTKIEQDVDIAVAEGDSRSLKYLRDRVIGETARTSLKAIHNQQTYIVEIVMSVVKTAIALAA